MKATEFIKKYGIGRAVGILHEWNMFTQTKKPTHFDTGLDIFIHEDDFKFLDESDVSIIELGGLIESWYLVFEHGSVERAKNYASSKYTAPENAERLKKAIDLVEQCNA